MNHQMKVETWLPVFSGFYGTIWETDGDEEMELDNINDERKAKNLPEISWDKVEWDFKGYTEAAAKGITRYIEKDLQTLGMVSALRFQELRSPREYNFANDSINVEVVLTKKNTKSIGAYLNTHRPAFTAYIKERYTSRSGFISSYTNDATAWLGAHLGPALGDAHKCGAILNFILLNENGDDYEMEIYERLHSNGVFLSAANYDELMGATI